jgi:hypothetical protein
MAWFFKKKDDVLDLTERYRKEQEKIAAIKEEASNTESSPAMGGFGVFGMASSTTTTTSSDSTGIDSNGGSEKKRRLVKRLMDMTDKIEELSNQIYHLQQRIEVLEKKNNTSGSYGVFN